MTEKVKANINIQLNRVFANIHVYGLKKIEQFL